MDPFTKKDWYDLKAPTMFATRTFVQRAAAAVVAVAVVAQPVAPALAYNNNSNGVSETRISKLCASNATSKTCTDSIGRAGLRDGTKQSATS